MIKRSLVYLEEGENKIMCRNAYDNFFKEFNINEDQILKYAEKEIIFGGFEQVKNIWDELKDRLLNNQEISIRNAGRKGELSEYYKRFIEFVFGNNNIKIDPTNNNAPAKIIKRSTNGIRKYDKKRNDNKNTVMNYQISHIFDNTTKNPLMFESPWNIVYMPKILDPFSGHESKGDLTDLFKKTIKELTVSKFKIFIKDYNEILKKYSISSKINDFIELVKEDLDSKKLKDLEKGLLENYLTIDLF